MCVCVCVCVCVCARTRRRTYIGKVVFEFLVSVINHYHINKLHLFWDTL